MKVVNFVMNLLIFSLFARISLQKLSKKEMENFRSMMKSFDSDFHTHQHNYTSDISGMLDTREAPEMPLELKAIAFPSDEPLSKGKKGKFRRLKLKKHKHKNFDKLFEDYDDISVGKGIEADFDRVSLSEEDGAFHDELSQKMQGMFDDDNLEDENGFSRFDKEEERLIKQHGTDLPEKKNEPEVKIEQNKIDVEKKIDVEEKTDIEKKTDV